MSILSDVKRSGSVKDSLRKNPEAVHTASRSDLDQLDAVGQQETACAVSTGHIIPFVAVAVVHVEVDIHGCVAVQLHADIRIAKAGLRAEVAAFGAHQAEPAD